MPIGLLSVVLSTGKRHRLLDGERISDLMLKNGIGVSTKETFVIQRMGEDFFLELEN
jgi:restriction endonuclease Mrr